MMGIVVMLSPGLFFVSGLLWLGILAMWGFSSLASLGVCLFLVLGGYCGLRELSFGGLWGLWELLSSAMGRIL